MPRYLIHSKEISRYQSDIWLDIWFIPIYLFRYLIRYLIHTYISVDTYMCLGTYISYAGVQKESHIDSSHIDSRLLQHTCECTREIPLEWLCESCFTVADCVSCFTVLWNVFFLSGIFIWIFLGNTFGVIAWMARVWCEWRREGHRSCDMTCKDICTTKTDVLHRHMYCKLIHLISPHMPHDLQYMCLCNASWYTSPCLTCSA